MKIRMKVEASGPDGMIQPGEEVEVGEATGGELIAAGLAETVEEKGEIEEPDAGEVMDARLAEDAPFDGDEIDEKEKPAENPENVEEPADEGGYLIPAGPPGFDEIVGGSQVEAE